MFTINFCHSFFSGVLPTAEGGADDLSGKSEFVSSTHMQDTIVVPVSPQLFHHKTSS